MSFYDEVITQSALFDSPARIFDLALVEPILRAAVQKIVADAAHAGEPLMVFETYRSHRRQALLYQQGATQIRTDSVHHYGLAVDLVRIVANEPTWKVSYAVLGRLAAVHGLVWGGNWHGFVDADHVQRIAVADQEKLFSGQWYPDASYSAVH